MSQPYLSLVIPTRNDAYPGNLALEKCLTVLRRQLENAGVDSEILIVEYNSDPSRPHLFETLRVEPGKHVTIRVICVDPKYHRRFRHSEMRGFHQACAVNIGLRRSRGEFFLYRAADHIYSDALVSFLGGKSLRKDTIYRCDRFDIDPVALAQIDPDDLSAISAVCERYIVDSHQPLDVEPSYRIPKLHTNSSGDFLLMSRDTWLRVAGLYEAHDPVFLDCDSLVLHASHSLPRSEIILPAACRVYKINHGMKYVARIQQVWSPLWKRWEEILSLTGSDTVINFSRMLMNYPRRRDKTFHQVLLDSYERNFVLWAFLWSHGFPFVRQNRRNWGLAGEALLERLLVAAGWEQETQPR